MMVSSNDEAVKNDTDRIGDTLGDDETISYEAVSDVGGTSDDESPNDDAERSGDEATLGDDETISYEAVSDVQWGDNGESSDDESFDSDFGDEAQQKNRDEVARELSLSISGFFDGFVDKSLKLLNWTRHPLRQGIALSIHAYIKSSKDIVWYIAQYLEPFDQMEAWTNCCIDSLDDSGINHLLRGALREFRVLKRYTDEIHERVKKYKEDQLELCKIEIDDKSVNWKDAMYVLLKDAWKQLRMAYGPYTIHPCHLAFVGEVVCLTLLVQVKDASNKLQQEKNKAERLKFPRTISDLWNWRDLEPKYFDGILWLPTFYFVCGRVGDERFYQEHKSTFSKNLLKAICDSHSSTFSKKLINSSASLPFINVFRREDHKKNLHTVAICPFEHDNNIVQGERNVDNFVTTQICVMTYRHESFGQCNLKCNSIQEFFCSYDPLDAGYREVYGWRQLLNVGWLRAHNIAPFDCSLEGTERWETLKSIALRDMQEGRKRKHPENDSEVELFKDYEEALAFESHGFNSNVFQKRAFIKKQQELSAKLFMHQRDHKMAHSRMYFD